MANDQHDDESKYWSEELHSYVQRYWSDGHGCYVERYRCAKYGVWLERYWCAKYEHYVTLFPRGNAHGANDIENWGRRRLVGRSGSDGRKERKEAKEWRLRRKIPRRRRDSPERR